MKRQNLGLISVLFLASCLPPPSRPNMKRDGSISGKESSSDSLASGSASLSDVGFTTALPRLTHLEWENSVRDVFLLPDKPGLAAKFSQDDNSTIFHNDSAANKVSSNLWKDYQEASEELGDRIASDAERVRALIPADAPKGEGDDHVRAVLNPLLRRAFRRNPSSEELQGYVDLYKKGRVLAAKADFDAAGLMVVTSALIQSPLFIYHPELGKKDGAVAKLNSYEVASRLSYALWKTIPDEILLNEAAKGGLQSSSSVKEQIQRMMKDPRAMDTLRFFATELFETKNFVNLKKNNALYPKFPNDLGDTLKREADMFIDDVIVKNNGGITKLLTESYTFVNDKTAPLYGVPLPGTMDLKRVELDKSKRAGLITQIGWLASNATSERTSTIHRGFYVMSRLACDQLPPQVGADSPNQMEFKTRRDELTSKTSGCGTTCHNNYINPPAFALEAFDAAGVYRDKENGNPIDTSGVYGKVGATNPPMKFANAVELMQGIVSRPSTHECYVKRMIELLYNRRANDSDSDIVKRLGAESLKGLGTRDLFVELLSDIHMLEQRNDNL